MNLEDYQKANRLLKIELRHLQNDSYLSREEYESATKNYLDLLVELTERNEELEELKVNLVKLVEQKTKELRESKESYKALVVNTADILMRFDREYRHLYVSPSVSNCINFSPEDFLGKTHKELGFPDYICEICERGIKTVFDTAKVFETEFLLEGNCGEIMFFWRVFPEFDQKVQVKTVMSVAQDITDKKKQEELQMELGKLQAANETAGAVCHEMNQPLQVISGYIDLFDMSDEMPAKLKEYARIAKEEMNRLRKITTALQNLQKYKTKDYIENKKILNLELSDIN